MIRTAISISILASVALLQVGCTAPVYVDHGTQRGGYGRGPVYNPPQHEDPPPYDERRDDRGPGMIIYEHMDFSGSRITLDGAVRDLRDIGWNDRISSFQIPRGGWEVCRGVNYKNCEVVDRNHDDIRNLANFGWNDRISSLRPVTGKYARRHDRDDDDQYPVLDEDDRKTGIKVFEHTRYRGEGRVFKHSVADLRNKDWNDTISSVKVRTGRWEICRGIKFRNCEIAKPGDRIENLAEWEGWNDAISSLRLIDEEAEEEPSHADSEFSIYACQEEIQDRVARDKGHQVRTRFDAAETYYISRREEGVRGKALIKKGRHRSKIEYSCTIDTRRREVSKAGYRYP
jgi:hypothetical protein